MKKWLIYGANGHTGKLIAKVALEHGLRPIVAGRSPVAIQQIAQELDLEPRVFDLINTENAIKHLNDINFVVNCAGPFSKTVGPLLDACLASKTHYLDITGEPKVCEYVRQMDDQSRNAKVLTLPGTGISAVTDCIAALVKELLPDAHELRLAYSPIDSSLSIGTIKTMLQGLTYGIKIRRDHQLVQTTEIYNSIEMIKNKPSPAIRVSSSDLITAYYSTGIPNIEIFLVTNKIAPQLMRFRSTVGSLLKIGGMLELAQMIASKFAKEPEQDRGQMIIWAQALNKNGQSAIKCLKTANGYLQTAYSIVNGLNYLLNADELPYGYATASQIYGAEFALTLEGVEVLN